MTIPFCYLDASAGIGLHAMVSENSAWAAFPTM
jgi:hypothetical protein